MTETLLGEVCDVTMGQAPPGESYNTDDTGVPLIAGAGDFVDGLAAPKKFTTSPSKMSQTGDIVLGIRASIGERVWSDREYCLGRGVAGLRPTPDRLDSKYLWHWVGYASAVLAAKGRGATFLQVSRRDIEELSIPLPPLGEQRRIAAILDQVDALRAKRRQALDHLDDLTQSIFLDMFGDPVRPEARWPTAKFGDVCDTRLGKMLDAKQQTGADPRYYLRNANVQWFRFDLSDVLTMDIGERSRESLRLEPGDLLICEGGRPGRSAIWAGEIDECYYQKALHRARPNRELATPEYLVWLLWLLVEGNGLAGHVTSATIAHLTGEKLKAVPVPLPPIDLQRQFSDRLTAVFDRRSVHETARRSVDELFASLQSRAFQGEL